MFAPVLSAALLLTLAPQDTYRAFFDWGLEALEAGDDATAAAYFLRAGELAPGAPVWKAYLERAGGTVPDSEGAVLEPADAWVPVQPARVHGLRFDATGERMLTEQNPAALFDARSGERIALLSHRGEALGSWRFDRTGRVIIGSGWQPPSWMHRGLDVRDARTGDPIEVAGDGSIAVPRDATFEWVPAGTPMPETEFGRIAELELSDGLLRFRVVETTANEDLAVSPDDSRAALLERHSPTTLRLFDTRSGETLAEVSPGGGRIEFSRSGRLLFSYWADPVLLLRADSGDRLPLPELAGQRPHDRGAESWCLDGDVLVWVRASGEALWWDPFLGETTRSVRLEPPPRSGVSSAKVAAGGERLIVFGSSWVQTYAVSTGQESWAREVTPYLFGGALSPDGARLAIGDPMLMVLDVRTGLAVESLGSQPLAISDLQVLDGTDGTDACVTACSDGSLRRVDLTSGATTAVALGQIDEGGPQLRQVGAGRLASTVPRKSLVLCSTEELAVEARVELVDEWIEAFAPEGRHVLVCGDDGEIELVETASGKRRALARTTPGWQVSPLGAFSPDGTRLAVGVDGRIRLFEVGTGEAIADFPVRESDNPGPLAFHGSEQLLVGWGNDLDDDEDLRDQGGVQVHVLPGGELVATLTWTTWTGFGGYLGALRSDPDIGRAAFSVSSAGTVSAFDDGDWQHVWELDFGGGNPSALELQRAPGSGRLCISGMTPHHARVVDLETGDVLAVEQVHGCYDLAETESGRFLVGERDGVLAVLDGGTYAELYTRAEGPDGAAWLGRGGGYEAVGTLGLASASRHLARGGVSRPDDCWEPWLHDPLGIAPAELDALPEPPRIVDGPPRVVRCIDPALSFLVETSGASALEVEVRGVKVVPVDQGGATSVEIRAPWPADVRLRAHSADGTRSAPWRVRIEPGG